MPDDIRRCPAALVHNCSWTSAENLSSHYFKHGGELGGFESEAEYQHAAIEMMCGCYDGTEPYRIFSDGVKSYHYNPATGEFGVKVEETRGIITYYDIGAGMDPTEVAANLQARE